MNEEKKQKIVEALRALRTYRKGTAYLPDLSLAEVREHIEDALSCDRLIASLTGDTV